MAAHPTSRNLMLFLADGRPREEGHEGRDPGLVHPVAEQARGQLPGPEERGRERGGWL